MEKDNEKIKSKIFQTYAEDMAKVIEDDKSGLIKKIIHGEEEHEQEKLNMSPESKKNKFFMFTGLLLISIGLVTLLFFFLNREIETVPVMKQFTPLIFNDKSAFIEVMDFKKEEIIQSVLNEINKTEWKNGGVVGIYLTEDKKIENFRRFMTLIKGNFQSQVDMSVDDVFVSDNFLIGAVNTDAKDFFILLKVRSITDVFNSLHAWEEKMFSDLSGFFGVDISSETKYLLTANFEDGIIQNKNARILYDQNKKIIMMYVFADDDSVIITDSENATREIMLRLASSQIKK